MATQLQKWARERNLNKGRVTSIRTLSRQLSLAKSTTGYESGILSDVTDLCDMVLEDWDTRAGASKVFYTKKGGGHDDSHDETSSND